MISQFHTVDNFIKYKIYYNCFFNIDLRNKPNISTVEIAKNLNC